MWIGSCRFGAHWSAPPAGSPGLDGRPHRLLRLEATRRREVRLGFLRSASTSRLLGVLTVAVATRRGRWDGRGDASGEAAHRRRLLRSTRRFSRPGRATGSGRATARVTFTNHLILVGRVARERRARPATPGALGRPGRRTTGVCGSSCRRTRATRRSCSNGPTLTVYDVHANTVYRLQRPTDVGHRQHRRLAYSTADYRRHRFGARASGRPYATIRRGAGTLAGTAGLTRSRLSRRTAADARRGRGRLGRCPGRPAPTCLSMLGVRRPRRWSSRVTDISYGAVSRLGRHVSPPATAKVTDLGS